MLLYCLLWNVIEISWKTQKEYNCTKILSYREELDLYCSFLIRHTVLIVKDAICSLFQNFRVSQQKAYF